MYTYHGDNMPKKTFYVSEGDVELFERLKDREDESMSGIITKAVRLYLNRKNTKGEEVKLDPALENALRNHAEAIGFPFEYMLNGAVAEYLSNIMDVNSGKNPYRDAIESYKERRDEK